MRREFPQRKPRRKLRGHIADARTQRPEAGQPVDVQRRLAVRRLHQVGLRSVKRHPAQRAAQHRVSLGEKLRDSRISRGKILAHAHGLGSLTCEKNSDAFCHPVSISNPRWVVHGRRVLPNGRPLRIGWSQKEGESLSGLTNELCEPLANDLHGWADSLETRVFDPFIHDSNSLAIAGNNMLARKVLWPTCGKFAGSPADAGQSNK